MKEVKECAECGKMHTRKKFCSPYCGCKYNANYKRNQMGVKDSRFTSRNINAIIQGRDTPIADNSFNFIFSNKIEDWLGSERKARRDRWREAKRKQKENKEKNGERKK